jgi:hypothetical protein
LTSRWTSPTPDRVRRVQGLGDLADELKRPARFERALRHQQRPQVGALHVTHRHPQLPIRLSGPVDGDDVGVIERGRQLRLTQEALAEARVGSQLRRHQFERHAPLQPQVLREVDDPHPAPAQHRLQPVAGQIRAEAGIRLDAHRGWQGRIMTHLLQDGGG